MKAIVHIGTEKTGTTSIQEFFHANRQALAQSGIAYPESPGLRNHRALATYCLPPDAPDDYARDIGALSSQQRRDWQTSFVSAFNTEMEVWAKSCDLVVFSSEHLQSRVQDHEAINRLKQLLARHCSEIRILVYLRRQDEVAVSRHSTALRAGFTPQTVIPQVGKPNHGFYNYLALVERWAKVFGRENLIIRRYSREQFHGGDLITDLCISCGLQEAVELPRPARKNESLSAQAQSMLLTVNEALNLVADGQQNAHKFNPLRHSIAEWLVSEYPGKSRQPSRDEARAMYGLFEESNKVVAQRYLGTDKLFSEDFDKYPEHSPRPVLDPVMVRKVLAMLISYFEGDGPPGNDSSAAARLKALISSFSQR